MKKILMVNKFLYPNGGSETYIFELGRQLEKDGNQVQYFGMKDERNIVGNKVASYTGNMDFHTGKLTKLKYPFKIIYSIEARKAIRKVLDDFKPDVVHLNNFNFQITPSVIYEIRKYEKQMKREVKIVFTAHDYQMVCPNHMMRCPKTEENCEKCINGNYIHCIKGKCIHGSTIKSLLGAFEGYFYKWMKTYKYIDKVICPSIFIRKRLEHNPQFRGKMVMLRNFSTTEKKLEEQIPVFKKEYIVYFGRYSKEKGIETLLKACGELPEIRFVFAGNGPLKEQINKVKNIEDKGFLTGRELEEVIRGARFSIYPSQWYENCPFSIMESIQYGTPVLGSDVGGIPELIDEGVTGELFECGNEKQLINKIYSLYNNTALQQRYRSNCLNKKFMSLEEYSRIMEEIY